MSTVQRYGIVHEKEIKFGNVSWLIDWVLNNSDRLVEGALTYEGGAI
jgi:hypothetical protein